MKLLVDCMYCIRELYIRGNDHATAYLTNTLCVIVWKVQYSAEYIKVGRERKCNETAVFLRFSRLRYLQLLSNKLELKMAGRVKIQERDFAFQNRLQTFSLVNRDYKDIDDFLNDSFNLFTQRIEQILVEHYIIKITACFHGIFEKLILTDEGGKKETQTMYLHTNATIIDFETSLRGVYDETIVLFIKNRIDEIQLQGSGFTLSKIVELNVQVGSFEPYAGSSFIPLPPKLQAKKAIII